jgi:uncharacterized protein with ATP-grasp and redox domains
MQTIRYITDEVREHALRDVMRRLLELEWSSNPIEMARDVHKVIRAIMKTKDPYEKVKKDSSNLAHARFLSFS